MEYEYDGDTYYPSFQINKNEQHNKNRRIIDF
jgi:hypothetical protein